ncbi:MAG: hypothetical protein LV481_03635 [Methylacidiphilales bacterium]|nr:hypothetical protein [Candidatus Methylacidiphilales bacterium]
MNVRLRTFNKSSSLAALLFVASLAGAGLVADTPPSTGVIPITRKIKVVDADNHTIVVNKPGLVTLLLGTSEDSQDAAREAGRTVYPLRGRPDFQLIVVVDLRDSLATWVPSLVLSQMRDNLDKEAVLLKPYYLKNGNKSNPRASSYVIADFNGSVCPQLGWTDSSGDLRGILFGANGHEIKRWQKIDKMDDMLADVWGAVQALDNTKKIRADEQAKSQGSKIVQPPAPPRPLPPIPTNAPTVVTPSAHP